MSKDYEMNYYQISVLYNFIKMEKDNDAFISLI